MLSRLLCTLYSADCKPVHATNTISLQMTHSGVADHRWGELAYRDGVLNLSAWFQAHNLILNTTKTKEIIMDFRRHRSELLHVYITGDCVEGVDSIR